MRRIMSDPGRIIIPGTDNPASIVKVLESLAEKARVGTLIVRHGERFLLKIVEVRKEVVVGEVRCLNWSPEMSRSIYESFHAERSETFTGEHRREVLFADAIDRFGAKAHRYRVYIPISEIVSVYEDMDDPFDQTPFLPIP